MEHKVINITTATIRQEGDFRGLQELPPELCRVCEEELAKHTGTAPVSFFAGSDRIIIDGKEYVGVQNMPQAVREKYEQFMAAVKAGENQQVTEITFNGRKYSSREDMPAGVRRDYEEAVAALHAPVRLGEHVTEIIFNGRKYSGVEEMPTEVRREYEGLLARMDGAGGSQRVEDTAGVSAVGEQVNFFYCRHCGKVLKAMESQGGMHGKCPCCGEMTSIPYVSTADADDSAEFVCTGAVHRQRHI